MVIHKEQSKNIHINELSIQLELYIVCGYHVQKLYISRSVCKFDVPVAQTIFTSEKSFNLRLGRMSICKRRCPSSTHAMATTLKPFRQGRLSLLWSGARSLAVLRVREKLVNNSLFSKIKITHKLPMYCLQTGILIKSKHHKINNQEENNSHHLRV